MRATELDQLQREETLRAWRTWCFVGGLVAYLIAVTTVWTTAGSPKTWASTYHALASAGALTWLVLPLAALGTALLAAALVATFFLEKK
jgi:hypothetical protein